MPNQPSTSGKCWNCKTCESVRFREGGTVCNACYQNPERVAQEEPKEEVCATYFMYCQRWIGVSDMCSLTLDRCYWHNTKQVQRRNFFPLLNATMKIYSMSRMLMVITTAACHSLPCALYTSLPHRRNKPAMMAWSQQTCTNCSTAPLKQVKN